MKIENKFANRNFGIVFFVVFLTISLWPLFNGNEIRVWSLVISLIFLILGILNSKILTPLNKAWLRFGIFLGNFISPIVMGIVFFLVVTPIGILMKLFRKDLINLKRNNKHSYWIDRPKTKNNMKKQF